MSRSWTSPASRAQLRVALLLASVFQAVPFGAAAQEALRYSLAGQDVAEARKRALENKHYSAELGPVSMNFGAGLGIEATDNVRNTENDPQADLIFRPRVNTVADWRVSERNKLSLNLGIGYNAYVVATDYDQFYISPNSDLSFDLYAGDFLINFHERFSYTGDVSDMSNVSGTGNLGRFENTVGTRVNWDLNRAFIALTYDHQNYISTETQYDYQDHSSELFTGTFGFQLQPNLQTGIQLGGGLLDYTQPLSQDNQHVSAGAFISGQPSEYTTFRFGGGYVVYFLETFGLPLLVSQESAFYLEASLSQRVNKYLAHTLAFGRSLQPQFGTSRATQLLEDWYVRYGANWNLILNTGLSTTFSYDHGDQLGLLGGSREKYGWYSAGISLSRLVAKNTNASIGYVFTHKNSDLAGNSYLANRLVLGVTYTF